MNSSIPATPVGFDHDLPSFSDITAAAERIASHAVVTPLLESPALNRLLGGRVLLKAETLQRTGSFKFRGAFNRISQIPVDDRTGGVVAYSSGNHAQGVAAAAEILGISACIVMPEDAPSVKIENTRGYGAEVKLYDRYGQAREALAEALAEERGATLVRPYDDPQIIAGQGTCGLEIATQAKAMGAEIDKLLICCGGGGLTAGCSLALKALRPQAEIFCVEPKGFDDTTRSLEAGESRANTPDARSICDALLAPEPGKLTFAINKRLLSGGLVVDDREVEAAMVYAANTLKLAVEPGGAVALAALLARRLDIQGQTVVAVLSGGNVDPKLLAQLLAEDPKSSD